MERETWFLGLGAAAFLAGAGLLLWALVWDRARGRRRCPRCWYEIDTAAGRRCSECGNEAAFEKQLHRTRRRWRWGLVGLVLAMGAYLVAHTPRIERAGWPGAVPTTALIWWVSSTEPPEEYRNGKMSQPTKAAAELSRRCVAGELADWQWRMVLHGLEIVRWRDKWPRGAPWQIGLNPPSWLTTPTLPIEAQLPDHLWYISSYPPGNTTRRWDLPGHGLPVETQPLALAEDHVDVKVTVGNRIGPPVGRTIWSGTLRLPVRLVDSAEDAVVPVSNAELDAAVKRALQTGIGKDRNQTTGTNLVLGARLYRSKGPVPDDIAVCVRVTLLREGKEIQSWGLSPLDSPFGEPVDWIRISMPSPGWDTSDPTEMAKWTVRVRGEPELALRDLLRPKCWGGEYTVPLAEFLY